MAWRPLSHRVKRGFWLIKKMRGCVNRDESLLLCVLTDTR